MTHYLSSYMQISLYIVSLFATASFIRLRWKSRGVRLPPSPPGEPFLGHARCIPLQYSWETFSAWAEALGEIQFRMIAETLYANDFYLEGDILYLSILGRPMIIINSVEVARELLDKKGATFSERPHSVVVNDL